MAEYIERKSAIDAIMAVYVGTAGYKARERIFAAEEAVHRLPVADVVPVRHGHWIDGFIPDSMLGGCSECGFTCGAHSFFYCPNCGAKMDGKDGDT